MKQLLLLILLIFSSGCTLLTGEQGYIDRMRQKQENLKKAERYYQFEQDRKKQLSQIISKQEQSTKKMDLKLKQIKKSNYKLEQKTKEQQKKTRINQVLLKVQNGTTLTNDEKKLYSEYLKKEVEKFLKKPLKN